MEAKFFVILALVAFAYAVEEERVKKDVVLGTLPYAYSALPYGYAHTYEDLKYYPGKYEKAYVAAPLTAYHGSPVAHLASPVAAPIAPVAPVAALPASVSAYSTHTVHPLPYANYPYHYSNYPFAKSYLY